MKKMIVWILFFALMVPAMGSSVVAAEKVLQAGVVDAGNKLCPISGSPVSGTHFVVYNGKRYGLCCPGCEGPFLKDPATYIAKMEAQEKASASMPAAALSASASKEMQKDMAQGSL